MHPQPYPPAQRVASDTPATVALVLGIVGLFTFGLTALVGAIIGHATRRNTPSQGLSTAAIVTSWAVFGFWVAVVLFFVVIPFLGFGAILVGGTAAGS